MESLAPPAYVVRGRQGFCNPESLPVQTLFQVVIGAGTAGCEVCTALFGTAGRTVKENSTVGPVTVTEQASA